MYNREKERATEREREKSQHKTFKSIFFCFKNWMIHCFTHFSSKFYFTLYCMNNEDCSIFITIISINCPAYKKIKYFLDKVSVICSKICMHPIRLKFDVLLSIYTYRNLVFLGLLICVWVFVYVFSICNYNFVAISNSRLRYFKKREREK